MTQLLICLITKYIFQLSDIKGLNIIRKLFKYLLILITKIYAVIAKHFSKTAVLSSMSKVQAMHGCENSAQNITWIVVNTVQFLPVYCIKLIYSKITVEIPAYWKLQNTSTDFSSQLPSKFPLWSVDCHACFSIFL